ncbi:hypothetical protein ACMD2_12036 [Ananas comosus]|uniref:Uncharacterized protein n=1 Tax=Ananas comosus TaxID=4615 RepID=A0A199UVT9_ANACO|nr:hypothetical protein ACMD2_12037 [Ananas comosus]OAY68913.1 hypothetical protein ACMD2_12036 [Ananas comosus]
MAAFGNKAMLALLLVAMLMAATVGPSTQEDQCFCNCLKSQCMTINGATKEECAVACNDGCTNAGYAGQPNPHDYCGLAIVAK